jgi:hypothetical protein
MKLAYGPDQGQTMGRAVLKYRVLQPGLLLCNFREHFWHSAEYT